MSFRFLRKGAGLTPARIDMQAEAEPLLRLPAVRSHALARSDPPTAVIQVITECVQLLPHMTDRLVADTVLGLRMYAAVYESQEGITQQMIRRLQDDAVTTRRRALLLHWATLHRALGADPAYQKPSERKLRGTIETRVFHDLIRLLLNRSRDTRSRPPLGASPSVGRVVVIGGVAIDHIWHVEQIPEAETSTLAEGYVRAPGGKGVSQAVAAARMGLDVSLVAAITNDNDSYEILDHLEQEGVDTSRMQRIPDLTTPQTCINEKPRGDSNAAVWRSNVQLDLNHLAKHADAMSSCDVLMVTFEIPKPVLYETLQLVGKPGKQSPIAIVTPGQPYSDGYLPIDNLGQIDYLVAHWWELQKFANSAGMGRDPEKFSKDLVGRGLKSLCLLEGRDSTIYTGTAVRQISAALTGHLKESSIARDVFCAALAFCAVGERYTRGAAPAVSTARGDSAIRWASAAMGAFAKDYRDRESLIPTTPKVPRVERELRELSERNMS
ncbi:ribokinase [Kribbella steppae]|uniref:Ribokinase n=1 Tax=Kribbella steppae TaxID=2512223 RepID=A0A4R2H889_9ACTN|nr:PfkB family carbohydrate kinase [Kribbella steppae]TCO23219.1 ribokinase [Kribbella steppae]